MSIHWRQLDTPGRIAAIRDAWFMGCSTKQIAASLQGATRNAIIGMYHRHPNSLIDKPLVRGNTTNEAGRAKKPRTKRTAITFMFKEGPKSKPLPKPREIMFEQHVAGRPIYLLTPKQCRWSVNEAARDEIHLFCGLPSERSYCDVHAERSRPVVP